MELKLKPRKDCAFDEISLGEVMLRLDPGDSRVRCARSFRAWEGGGEYNVARGLRRCFGMKTGVVTALAENDVGYLIEDFILQGGVDPMIQWAPYDGIGRKVRNGLNFTEKGFGVRGALGISDRANTAASQMKPGDVDWETLFGVQGVRWFHTGGIYAALSETTAEVVLEAAKAAKMHGVVVSYDLNYRPSLWRDIGGKAKAQAVNKALRDALPMLTGTFDVAHICGKGNLDPTLDKTPGYTQVEFLDKDLPDVLAAADLVLSRAGSNALMEFQALARPLLLVPYPKGASRGDQILNAQSLEKRGLCHVLLQENMTPQTLTDALMQTWAERDKLTAAVKNAPPADGTKRVLEMIEEVQTRKA